MDMEAKPPIFEAFRYGEAWMDLMGDNLVYYLVCKINDLEEEIQTIYEERAKEDQ